MKAIILFLSCAIFVALTGCSSDDEVTPSGTVTSVSNYFSDYSGLIISHGFKVFVTFSETEEEIEIEADDNIHAFIELYKTDNRLIIKIKSNVSIQGPATMNVYITTKHVNLYAGSGGSVITLENKLMADEVDVELSGGSGFTGDLHTAGLAVELSGGSRIDITGESDTFRVGASGGSSFRNYDFSTDQLVAYLSGGSQGYVTVNQEIEVNASGGSTLYYNGDVTIVNEILSGGSRIVKVN
ncbi:MAG: DUF2807 domain-containing protein [Marinilabiliaceae bacterium]|nr:DUF2807 domain-containing protein [Marinilabiliaceae bacterium]